MCTNRIKTYDLSNPVVKTNWISLIILITSFVTHVLVQIKILTYKLKKKNSVHIISRTEFIKNVGILDIDQRSLSSLATNIINVVLTGILFFISTAVNHKNFNEANKYPVYLLFYFYNLIFPFILFGAISLTYYSRHPPLRKVIYREIISFQESK